MQKTKRSSYGYSMTARLLNATTRKARGTTQQQAWPIVHPTPLAERRTTKVLVGCLIGVTTRAQSRSNWDLRRPFRTHEALCLAKVCHDGRSRRHGKADAESATMSSWVGTKLSTRSLEPPTPWFRAGCAIKNSSKKTMWENQLEVRLEILGGSHRLKIDYFGDAEETRCSRRNRRIWLIWNDLEWCARSDSNARPTGS